MRLNDEDGGEQVERIKPRRPIARATEFEFLADEVRAERRALQLCRARITLCRRDIAKMITFG